MTTQTEFLQTHAATGVMTPDLAAQLLELGQGDTGPAPELDGAPDTVANEAATTTQAAPSTNEGAQAPAPVEPNAENSVILAKDGKHTIPYEKLEEARRNEQNWRNQAIEAQAKLEQALAEASQRQQAGAAPTAADNAAAAAAAAIQSGEVDPAIFGDFSEADIAKGVAKLVKQQVSEAMVEVNKTLEPIKVQEKTSAVNSHYQAIYSAHPDADSIAQSRELADWIAAQPSFARDAYMAILDENTGGTAQQVIELFDAFKKATGIPAAQASTTVDPKAAVKAAIANAQPVVPASLSDFPGGRAGASNRMEALAALPPMALAEALAEMTPDQRELYLSRQM